MAQPTIQSGSIATYIGFYSSGSPTRTISVTVGAGTNRTIFCAVAFQQGSSQTVPAGFAITYGGTAMTLVGSYGIGANSCAVLYKLDDPAVGTASLVVGNSSVSVLTSFTLAAFVADGLNGSGRLSALSNTSAASGVATPKNVSIAATGDDITLYLVATNKSDVAAASGQTALLATSLIGIDTQYCNFSYKLGSSSSVGSTWAAGTAQLADSAIVLKGTASALTWTGTIGAQTGTVGTAISALATSSYVSGGTSPYTYSATGLPPGLSINASTGSITGTPTTAGTYTVTVSATDSAGSPATVSSASFSWTISAAAATAITMTGPSGGQTGVASANFTVGANGAISGSHVVTPSSGGGGGTFTPATVTLTAGSPTGTFTYTPSSVGAKTISASDAGGYTAPTSLTYTSSATSGTFTSEALKDNTGAVIASQALTHFTLYDNTTGALVVRKTGLSTNSGGVVSFADGALLAGTTYKADWLTAAGHYRMPAKAAT